LLKKGLVFKAGHGKVALYEPLEVSALPTYIAHKRRELERKETELRNALPELANLKSGRGLESEELSKIDMERLASTPEAERIRLLGNVSCLYIEGDMVSLGFGDPVQNGRAVKSRETADVLRLLFRDPED
jgi:hypothetical protein